MKMEKRDWLRLSASMEGKAVVVANIGKRVLVSETELMAEGWPLFKVCAWIGNTEKVAAAHYLQITDEDFAKASGVRSVAPGSGQVAQQANQKRQDPHFHAGIAVNAGLEPYEVAQDRGGIPPRKWRERRDFRKSAARRGALEPFDRIEIFTRKVKPLARKAGGR